MSGYPMKTTQLHRIYRAASLSIYEADDGGRYTVKPVDRSYTSAAPVYQLTYEAPTDSVPRYMSGLFKTSTPGKYSGDAHRITGKKNLFHIVFSADGETAEIIPRPRQQRRRKPNGYAPPIYDFTANNTAYFR